MVFIIAFICIYQAVTSITIGASSFNNRIFGDNKNAIDSYKLRYISEMQDLRHEPEHSTRNFVNKMRSIFNYCDKNRNMKLEPKEFKRCLLHSLGYSLKEGEKGNIEVRHLIQAITDGSGQLYVTFEEFLDFMIRETEDSDKVGQFY